MGSFLRLSLKPVLASISDFCIIAACSRQAPEHPRAGPVGSGSVSDSIDVSWGPRTRRCPDLLSVHLHPPIIQAGALRVIPINDTNSCGFSKLLLFVHSPHWWVCLERARESCQGTHWNSLRLALQQEPHGCTQRHSLPSPASMGLQIPSSLLSPTPEVQGLCTCKDFISTSQQALPSNSVLARPIRD